MGIYTLGLSHRWCYSIFSSYWKLMGKPIHFPGDVEYHWIGTWWKRSSCFVGKVWLCISQVSPTDEFYCILLWYGKLTGKSKHFSSDIKYHILYIYWEFDGRCLAVLLEKYGYLYPKLLPRKGFMAFFYAMGNWWESLFISYVMQNTKSWEFDEKEVVVPWEKHRYVPDLLHKIGFAAFPHGIRNWW